MITCVSCFYDVVNKHGDYTKWFSNTLRVNAPYVIFGTATTIKMLKPFRDGLPTMFIEREMADFRCGKFESKMVLDARHCPSIELNKIWSEKIFFLQEAKHLNPFDTEWFAWADAGLCLYRDVPPPAEPLIARNLSCTALNYSESQEHVVTGTYALHSDMVDEFVEKYEKALVEAAHIYTDQIILSAMQKSDPGIFHRACFGYGKIFQMLYEDKVSVIIPTYNRFKYLKRTIQFIRNQTYANLEIVVVNDGSTQPEYYHSDWNDVRIIHMRKNSKELYGFAVPGVIRNIGIANSDGKYVAFCDDDDLWHPNKLQMQVASMKKTGCHMSSTNALNSPRMDNYFKQQLDQLWTMEYIKSTNYVICSSVILSRDLISLAGYFKPMPEAEDYEYWKRIMLHTNSVYLAEPLVIYDTKHGDGRLYGNPASTKMGMAYTAKYWN